MAISGIGIQQILPRTGTGWQDANPAPDRATDSDSADAAPAREPSRSPPAPGTGQIVDRTV